MPRAPARAWTRRAELDRFRARSTLMFWATLVELARQYLFEMHGGDADGGGAWTTQSSSHDVERAVVLARRAALADPTLKAPPNFVKCYYEAATEATIFRVRQYLRRWGFNPRVAGQIPSGHVASRLAMMPTLAFDRIRDHGRRKWNKQFERIYGTLYILELGSGLKSWNRWINECVATPWRARIVVVTIDYNAKMAPDILGDITKWRSWLMRELKTLGHENTRWHIIHFASECTEFSPQKSKRDKLDEERDLVGATWLAQCGMQVIIKLRPLVWFIECSGAGSNALKTMPCMDCTEMRARLVDLTLCNAGADIRKESSWWTNIPREILSIYGFPEKSCCHSEGRSCLWKLLFARHIRHVGGGRGAGDVTLTATREESMQYPPLLCAQWISSAVHAMLYFEEATIEV